MSAPSMVVRAEHDSLREFLLDNLSDRERERIGLLSFNQWPWTTAACIETAVAAHQIGSDIAVGFWSDHTPLRDPGWTTSRRVARLLRTQPIEQSARSLIQAAGVPDTAFAQPPIRRHKLRNLPALPKPLSRASIRRLTYLGSDMGRSILQVHPDFNTPARDDYIWPSRWVARAIRSYAWVFDQTAALIKQRGLTTLVVFNGRFSHDRAAAAAAESLGVKVLYYDYGGLETFFDLTHTTTHDWDALQRRMVSLWQSWGADREEIAQAWFANRENHTEPGIEVFIGEQKQGFVPELPAGNRLVVFFSSSGDEIAELDLDWSKFFGSQEQALRVLAAACDRSPDTTLVVRTHPHMRLKPADDLERWTANVVAIGSNIHIGPESPTDSYALMRAADLVITYGSTSGVEASFRGKPTAVMGPSAYQLLGCVTPLSTEQDLHRWLAQPTEPKPDLALPYGLMMQRRGFNLRWLTKDNDHSLRHGAKALTEASPLARKISHRINTSTTKWLTSR